MKKKNFFVGALVLFSQFFGCSDDFELPNQNQSHLSSTKLLDKTTSARGPESANATYFPLFQLFLAKTNAECDAKVDAMINHFFYGNDNERIYYESGSNMAYIYNMAPDSSDNPGDDVRSEGMSYGMMITVQLDMKEEFDKLWRWADTYMLNKSGPNTGYFAWRCRTNGNKVDSNPAPDGEEYFAMSLYFAHSRWGSNGEINYKQAADDILYAMLNNSGAGPMMRPSQNNLICFQPQTNPDSWTDPSYHLPAFYELFAEYSGNSIWNSIATASRQYLSTTIQKSPYGLVPDYTDYSGNGVAGGSDHQHFKYDAWRTVMNVAIDNTFFFNEANSDYGTLDGHYFAGGYTQRLLNFFKDQGINDYTDLFTINGERLIDQNGQLMGDHSVGLVAMNAAGARVCNNWSTIVAHAQEFWDIYLPTGEWRYYNGCLYMLSMLYCTGNFNLYKPNGERMAFNLHVGNDDPDYGTVNFKSSWTGKVLTATANQNDADIKAQPNNDSWTSQDWEIEPVEGSTNVRLKNKWTGKYINVQNQNENAKVVCYELHEDWLSMQWIMEPISGTDNQVRLKNAWSGKYLTVENTSSYANIWAQSLNTSWPSQKWIVE